MYDEYKSDREIIKELNINQTTFYDYKKRIHDEDSKIWDLIHANDAQFRVTQLITDLERCRNECLKIVATEKDNRIRMEALRTSCEASANISKLLQEGPTFKTSLGHEQIKAIIGTDKDKTTEDNEFTLDLEDNTEIDDNDSQDTAIAKINRET